MLGLISFTDSKLSWLEDWMCVQCNKLRRESRIHPTIIREDVNRSAGRYCLVACSWLIWFPACNPKLHVPNKNVVEVLFITENRIELLKRQISYLGCLVFKCTAVDPSFSYGWGGSRLWTFRKPLSCVTTRRTHWFRNFWQYFRKGLFCRDTFGQKNNTKRVSVMR